MGGAFGSALSGMGTGGAGSLGTGISSDFGPSTGISPGPNGEGHVKHSPGHGRQQVLL
jgi:hypothetical protein